MTNRCIQEKGALAKKLKLFKTTIPVKPPVKSPVKPPVKSPVKSPIKSHAKSPVKPHVKSPVKPPVKSPTKPPVKSPAKPAKMKTPMKKICPPGKILNEKTNRCINADGALAKKLKK